MQGTVLYLYQYCTSTLNTLILKYNREHQTRTNINLDQQSRTQNMHKRTPDTGTQQALSPGKSTESARAPDTSTQQVWAPIMSVNTKHEYGASARTRCEHITCTSTEHEHTTNAITRHEYGVSASTTHNHTTSVSTKYEHTTNVSTSHEYRVSVSTRCEHDGRSANIRHERTTSGALIFSYASDDSAAWAGRCMSVAW